MPNITIEDLKRGHKRYECAIDLSFDSNIYICDFLYFGEGYALDSFNSIKSIRIYRNLYKNVVAIALCKDESELTKFDFVSRVSGVTGSQLCMLDRKMDADLRESIINLWDQCYAAGDVISIFKEMILLLPKGEDSLLCINSGAGGIGYDIYRTNNGYLLDYQSFSTMSDEEHKEYHRENNRISVFINRLIGRFMYPRIK